MKIVLSLLIVLSLSTVALADCSGGTCRASVRKAVKSVAVAPVKVAKAKPVRKAVKGIAKLCHKGKCQ